jgi:hypothetical protein
MTLVERADEIQAQVKQLERDAVHLLWDTTLAVERIGDGQDSRRTS